MAEDAAASDPAKDITAAMRLYLAPDFDSVRVALARVATELERHGVAPDRIGGAELVLAEVLNNIVEHAFLDMQGRGPADEPGDGRGGGSDSGPGGVSEGRIEIAVAAVDGRMRCDVRDNGCAMPGGKIPLGSPMTPGLKLSDLPEGGFGWFLIRSLVEELDYRRDGRENILSFSIPFDPHRMDA